MRRSVLLFLISAIVLSAALPLPPIWEDSESDSEYNDYSELSKQQNLKSSIEKTISKRATKDTSNSTEDDELTDGSNENVNDKMDSSMESSSMLIMASEEESESAVRRRRSGERNRNIGLLATICPNADFRDLENGITLDSRIEIRDMYAICKTLPQSGRLQQYNRS